MALQGTPRISAVLTSFAKGGLVRAQLSEGEDLQPGNNVVAFDDLAELEVRAMVVRTKGEFAYLRADWNTAQEYLPYRPQWYWDDVVEIHAQTVWGPETFSRLNFQTVEAAAPDQHSMEIVEPVFYPGAKVLVTAPVPGATATFQYRMSRSSGYMTVSWDTAPALQVYREIPLSIQSSQKRAS